MPPAPPPLSQGPFIEDPTDEDYANAARAALSAKDMRLALEQAAAAASLRPLHEPHVKLLDEVIAATKGPLLALEPKPTGTFFGLIAARARALARFHRMGEALDCLLLAATFSPKTPFLPWGLPWVAHAKDAGRVVPETLALGLLKLVEARAVPVNLQAAREIAAKVHAAAGDGDGALVVARSRVLRALGQHDEALALLAGRKDWGSVVERGAVHRDRGETEARVRCFEEARTIRPDNLATLLDLGDAYLDDARLEDAAGAYEKALRLHPSDPWAKTSLAYTRSLDSGEPMSPPTTDDPRELALFFDAGTCVTRLSDPIDPVVGVIRSVAQNPPGGDRPIRVRVRAERPLAPSARMAFQLVLTRLGRDGSLEVIHEGPGEPRPGPLWKLEAGSAVPVAPSPSPEVLAHVGTIATTPFSWAAWCAAVAADSPGSIEELLAAAAHVPAPPAERDVVQHVFGFQVAAILGVALGPGEVDARIEALSQLLEGEDDWTAAAAWLGLRALAEANPDRRAELELRARAKVPSAEQPLSPMARTLAVTGAALSSGEGRIPYLQLRARVRRELAER